MYDRTYILCALFVVVSSHYNGSYSGVLNSDCVKNYNRIFVTRTLPPRTYKYFHELHDNSKEHSSDIDLQFRIVGGNQVSIEQVPYTVLYGLYCGGVIIAPDWVITAAHCKDKEAYVIAGSSQRSQGTRYPICAHFIHPMWDGADTHNHDYDYQLVMLEKPIPVTSKSRPIAIAGADEAVPGAFVAVSGWGHVQHKEKMQDYIRRVYVPIINIEECRKLPNKEYHNNITPRMFCAGLLKGSKDSCQGDSGGPAVIRGKLLGIVSFGVGCASANQPGVYSNVAQARDWIRFITALPL